MPMKKGINQSITRKPWKTKSMVFLDLTNKKLRINLEGGRVIHKKATSPPRNVCSFAALAPAAVGANQRILAQFSSSQNIRPRQNAFPRILNAPEIGPALKCRAIFVELRLPWFRICI